MKNTAGAYNSVYMSKYYNEMLEKLMGNRAVIQRNVPLDPAQTFLMEHSRNVSGSRN